MNIPGEQIFKVIQNPNHRSMLAWSWIAIMSLAIAYVAGRQLIVIERQNAVFSINTAQTAMDQEHEYRIRQLELFRVEQEQKIKALQAHLSAGVK
jgi:hypothetical protein